MGSDRPTVVLICKGYQQSFEQGRYYDYQEFQRNLVGPRPSRDKTYGLVQVTSQRHILHVYSTMEA